jgi:hypothetical protein
MMKLKNENRFGESGAIGLIGGGTPPQLAAETAALSWPDRIGSGYPQAGDICRAGVCGVSAMGKQANLGKTRQKSQNSVRVVAPICGYLRLFAGLGGN